jgi:hypothetical protein
MGDVPRREVEAQSREVKHQQRIRMLLSIKDDDTFICFHADKWPAIWMSINEFLMSKRPSWAPPHCYNLSNGFQVPTLPSFWNKANNAAWKNIGASSGETFSV